MAIFNPQLKDEQPSFTQRSEGVRPVPEQQGPPPLVGDYSKAYAAKAKATEIGTYADLFGQGVKAADNLVQHHILGEIQRQTDDIRDEYGVGAAALQQADVDLQPQPLPAQLEDAGKDIEGLTAAYQSGRLKDSHYWARLESMSRQLKTRFPGYIEDIDQMVRSVAGATPANALRAQLQEEASQAARDAANDPRLKFIMKMADPKDVLQALPDFWQREASGNPYSMGEIVAATSRVTANKAEIEAAKSKVELDQANGKQTSQQTMELATRQSNDMWDTVLRTAAIGTFGSMDKFMEHLQDMNRRAGLGETIAPKETADMLTVLNNWEAQMDMGLTNMVVNDYSGKNGGLQLTTEQVAQLRSDLKARFQTLKDSLSEGKGFNIANANAIYTKLRAEADVKGLDENQFAHNLSVVTKAYGQEVANFYLSQEGNVGGLQAALQNQAMMGVMSGNSDSLIGELRKFKEGGITDGKQYLTFTRKVVSTLSDERIPAEDKARTAKILFGPENQKLLAATDPKIRMQFYQSLFSPQTFQALKAMKDAGDTQSWSLYVGRAEDAFMAINGEDSATTQQGLATGRMTLKMDPSNFHLVHDPNSKEMEGGPKGPVRNFDITRAATSVTQLNREIDLLVPILKENGEDPGMGLIRLLDSMGTFGSPGSIINQLWQGLNDLNKPQETGQAGG